MNQYILEKKQEFENAVEHLKKEMSGIRTGRANTALVEDIQVEAYGNFQPLKQTSNISVSDSQTIMVEPWDKSILKEVEKAMAKANIGLSVLNTGERIIAKVPQMTEETRKQMVKVLGEKVEDTRISFRQVRDKIKENIIEAEKNKEVTEDDRYKFITELDNTVADYNKQIEALREDKETSIMTI